MVGCIYVVINVKATRVYFSRSEFQEGGLLEKMRSEAYKIGSSVGRLLGRKISNDNKTGPSVRLRGTVCNTFLISVGGGLHGGGLVKYVEYMIIIYYVKQMYVLVVKLGTISG